MGIQVTYEMTDLLKNKELEVKFESEVFYDDGKPYRYWAAFTSDGVFLGQAITDDVIGPYWFDNRSINHEAVAVLDKYGVPRKRC